MLDKIDENDMDQHVESSQVYLTGHRLDVTYRERDEFT